MSDVIDFAKNFMKQVPKGNDALPKTQIHEFTDYTNALMDLMKKGYALDKDDYTKELEELSLKMYLENNELKRCLHEYTKKAQASLTVYHAKVLAYCKEHDMVSSKEIEMCFPDNKYIELAFYELIEKGYLVFSDTEKKYFIADDKMVKVMETLILFDQQF